jgi:hypothetical protein
VAVFEVPDEAAEAARVGATRSVVSYLIDGAKLDPKFRILSLNRRRARHYAGGGVMLRLRRPLAFYNPYSPL